MQMRLPSQLRELLALGAFVVALTDASLLLAGGGTIVPPATPGDPAHLNLVFGFPAHWPLDAMDDLEARVDTASQYICDATEGQVVIGTVQWALGQDVLASADAVFHPDARRATVSTNSNGFGEPIDMPRMPDSHTIAHELMHYVYGLRDQYEEQVRFGGGCGVGRSTEPGGFNEYSGSMMAQGRHDVTRYHVNAGLAYPQPGVCELLTLPDFASSCDLLDNLTCTPGAAGSNDFCVNHRSGPLAFCATPSPSDPFYGYVGHGFDATSVRFDACATTADCRLAHPSVPDIYCHRLVATEFQVWVVSGSRTPLLW